MSLVPLYKARFASLLGLILIVYVVLAGYYSVTNPLFEAPDEQWHFMYVRHIASGQGLPIQSRNESLNVAGAEGGQAPLYYLLGGLLTSGIPGEELGHYIESNPAGSRGNLEVQGNKNVWVQLKLDSYP